MNEAYTQELRADSSLLIIPTTTLLTVFISLLFIVLSQEFEESWHYGLVFLASPITARLAWRLIKKGEQSAGSSFFIAIHLLLLALVLVREWQPGSAIPYFFGVLVMVSSMIRQPRAGFYTWLAATFLTIAGLALNQQASIADAPEVAASIVFNFILAVAAFLSAIEWQVAVESVSELHRRAQHRRDELFSMKEELSWTNARLQYLNQQLEAARQEAVNERDLRTRFMNNVSHELRTPLNAIVNFAHILAQGGRGQVTPQQVDYLERIEQSGWHLLSVLNDLLDMAQIEAGEFKLHLEIPDLHSICEEAMGSIRGLVLDKDIQLIRDYPEHWPLVYVDYMRLKQALINLLGNAAKYTEQGHIALRVCADEQFVNIMVEDTGPGIALQHHEIIFQEFRQIDETAARRRIGTGLGLPITRHLVERQGGTISLTSAPGQGSTFTITLPIFRAEFLSSSEATAEHDIPRSKLPL